MESASQIPAERCATHFSQKLKSVYIAILFRKIANIRFRCDPGASDSLHENLWFILVSKLMNILPQPGQELTEVSFTDLVIEIADIFSDLFPKLCRNKIPQRVRREITDRAERPMNILQ